MHLQLYEFLDHVEGETRGFFPTREAARQAARAISPEWRNCCRIYLVEVPISKADVVIYINGGAARRSFKRLRTFSLTKRGGLVELHP